MTDEQARDLGQRALAAGFRCGADGVAVVDQDGYTWRRAAGIWRHDRGLHNGRGYQPTADDPGEGYWTLHQHNPWPDFRDPATEGALDGQLRERYGPYWCCQFVDTGPQPPEPGERTGHWHSNSGHAATTRLEVKVAALEAAP